MAEASTAGSHGGLLRCWLSSFVYPLQLSRGRVECQGLPLQRVWGEFAIRILRLEKETQVIVQFPDNPVARDSVTQYVTALKSVYARVADAHSALPAQGAGVVGR